MTSRDEDVVIVGNGVSAFACACRLADRGRRVTMIGPGLPHDRPPLSKRALRTGRLPVLADAAALRERGIEHVDGWVRAIDPGRRRLTIAASQEADPVERVAEGPLVWATGLEYVRPAIAGLEGAHVNATAPGFTALVDRLAGRRLSVVVLGAGLIGVETAAALAPAHDVILLDLAERPLPRLHDPIPALAEATLRDLGVRFVGGCRVAEVAGGGDGPGRRQVTTGAHGDFDADVIVVAAGVAATVPRELSGDRAGSLHTDPTLRVRGVDRIWACGDCATIPHRIYGEVSFPHWDWARRTGAHAADSILGAGRCFDADPFWFSTIGPLHLQELGIAESAVGWEEVDALRVGCALDGTVVAVLMVNAPARLAEARTLLHRGR